MILGTLGLAAQEPDPTGPGRGQPLVLSADIDTVIHPVSAEFMIQTLARADEEKAALVVFTLRTPGGLLDATRDIVTAMIDAATPVAVFVAPSGARAASAGFILVLASDVAAMAPGTHIGAAHPVSGSGEAMDEVMSEKAASDMAAYARTLATSRRRNVEYAEQAVTDSRAFTEGEALGADPPLIDFVVADMPALLQALDGQEVLRFDGTPVRVRTAGARIVTVEMTWRQQLLSAIAHPNIAYILLSLGTLGLTIELWSPGTVLPGVAGALCLLLAFFALQILPVNIVGLGLLGLGVGLLVLEAFVASFGVLTVGGIAALLFGSLMLFDTGVPGVEVSLRVILPVTLAVAVIMAFLVRLGIAAQRKRPETGAAGLLEAAGEALTALAPDQEGQVRAHGEIWRAVASEPIAPGARVRISAVEGLLLTVRPDRPDAAVASG